MTLDCYPEDSFSMDRYPGINTYLFPILRVYNLHPNGDRHWYLSPGYVSNSKRHRKSTLCIQRIMNDGSKRESINCHHYRKGERRATLPSCLLPLLLFEFRQFQSNSTSQRRWRQVARRTATRQRNSTAVIWRWNGARRRAVVWHIP